MRIVCEQGKGWASRARSTFYSQVLNSGLEGGCRGVGVMTSGRGLRRWWCSSAPHPKSDEVCTKVIFSRACARGLSVLSLKENINKQILDLRIVPC